MSPVVALSHVEELRNQVRAGYAPPTKLKISEFSDREIVVTSGPLAGTKWRTDFAPYQRGILDAFHEPGVQFVVVMGSSQWGKTSIAVNIVAYHIKHDPCSILVIEPTVEPMAKDFARNRLDPTIAASPALAAVVSRRRLKDSTNTTLQKTFQGGNIAIGGANSASSLAARTVRLLVLDEVDRYPAEQQGEGSTIAIAIKRTSAYRRRRRVFMPSSPTLTGAPIDVWYHRGDQRKYFVPCPQCGVMHPFEWSQVQWKDGDPRTARLHCPACDYPISESERVRPGEWRSTRPPDDPELLAAGAIEPRDPAVVSFHLWEAYSPLSSLAEIVRGFQLARAAQKAGDKAEMHTWTNTTLGEPVEVDAGDGADGNLLLLRRKVYEAEVPAGACCLTMGVDTQDDRLELVVMGWGPAEESWVIDRRTLPGDPELPETWKMLDEVLDQPYRHAGGQRLPIQATCIDSAGHRTTFVYDYAHKNAARRVYAIIGRDGQRPIVSSPSPRTWGRHGRKVPLYTIGVDAAKSLIVSRLKLTESGPGYVHLPHADWCDEEFTAQLTAEVLKKRWHKGVPTTYWQKTRTRNEALDCSVYAVAALRLLNPKLPLLAEQLAALSTPGATPPPAAPPRRRVGHSTYLKGGS